MNSSRWRWRWWIQSRRRYRRGLATESLRYRRLERAGQLIARERM